MKNSWGATTSEGADQGSWGIDGTGYFYLSYYDQSLCFPEAFDFVTPNDDDLSFGKDEGSEVVNEYQYAFMPGDPESKSYDTVTSSANIYEIGGDGLVRDVAVQTRSQNTKVRYDLYLLEDGATTPTDGELVWSKEAEYRYGGFHRAEVDASISVKKGDKVGVVVTTQLPNGSYEIKQNRRISRFFVTAVQPNPADHNWGQAVVNPGESFIGTPTQEATFADGTSAYQNYTWVDTSEALKQGEDEFQKLLGQNGLGEAYQACLDQLDLYQKLKVEKDTSHDPEVEAALAKYQELQQQFAALANAMPDTLDAAWYATDNYPITLTTTAADVTLYRVYNPADGEHLYTADAHERDVLVNQRGWVDENVAWTCPARSSQPVYRLYDPATGEHFYTTSAHERDVLANERGWTDEGVGFYSDTAETVPVHRLYNPQGHGVDAHLFTKDSHERDVLVNEKGWTCEDGGWYAKA